MLEAMSSMELTMWQAFFIERHRREEERAERAKLDRRLLGEDV